MQDPETGLQETTYTQQPPQEESILQIQYEGTPEFTDHELIQVNTNMQRGNAFQKGVNRLVENGDRITDTNRRYGHTAHTFSRLMPNVLI